MHFCQKTDMHSQFIFTILPSLVHFSASGTKSRARAENDNFPQNSLFTDWQPSLAQCWLVCPIGRCKMHTSRSQWNMYFVILHMQNGLSKILVLGADRLHPSSGRRYDIKLFFSYGGRGKSVRNNLWCSSTTKNMLPDMLHFKTSFNFKAIMP